MVRNETKGILISYICVIITVSCIMAFRPWRKEFENDFRLVCQVIVYRCRCSYNHR